MKTAVKKILENLNKISTSTISWLTCQLVDLWALHTHALRTRSSYRAEVVAVVIGLAGLLALDSPLDLVIAAAITAYVTYYQSHHPYQDHNPDPFT